ncbi:transglycosylase SLT domain-containing protein [Streptomyces sp. NPDC001422]|uniref:transglycosylase SLT domain-containing protein n=1 Tax=Streptomyces sp. NPDC001422 TaxID=3364575 RepID=UPI0036BE4038
MAESTKGIKVGDARIEINADMDVPTLERQLQEFKKAVEREYKRTSDITQAYNRLRARLEDEWNAKYGAEVKARLAAELKANKERDASNKLTTANMLKALKTVTVAAEKEISKRIAAEKKAQAAEAKILRDSAKAAAAAEKAKSAAKAKRLEDSARMDREIEAMQVRMEAQQKARVNRLERLEIASARLVLGERKAAAGATQAAYTSAFTVRKAELLEEMRLDREARAMELRGLQDVARQSIAMNRQRLRESQSALRSMERDANRSHMTIAKALKRSGDSMHAWGTSMGEFGRSITRNLVTPIVAATAAMSVLGIKAADSIIQSQTALQRMGISNKDTSGQLDALRTFGVQTPYSVEDMFKYGTQYARAARAHGLSGKDASNRATHLVQSIGDLAAFSGITDPAQVSRAMYAVSIMQDADRASLRNVKSLADNAGIPIQELAETFGFQNRKFSKKELSEKLELQKKKGVRIALPKEYTASAQMMDWMADAKTTGGVPGEGIVEALIKKGQESGIKGAAESQGSATIGARLSNMFEQGKFGLSNLFIKEGKDGQYKYTGAGEALMGKKHVDNREYLEAGRGAHGREIYKKNPNYGKVTYEGGLLQKATDIAKDLRGPSSKMVTEFFTELGKIADWAKKTTDWLKDHPDIADAIGKITKFALIIGGGAIVAGGLVKGLGSIAKLASPFAKALVGTTKVALQVSAGFLKLLAPLGKAALGLAGKGLMAAGRAIAGSRLGQSVGRGIRSAGFTSRYAMTSRAGRAISATGRGISRATSATTGFVGDRARDFGSGYGNTRDRLNGGNRAERQRLELDISGYEASLKKAEEELKKFQREYAELNRQNLNKAAKELANSDHSVQQAAQKAAGAVRDVAEATKHLNGLRLAHLKGQFDEDQSEAASLREKVQSVINSVSELNREKLSKLKGQVDNVKDDADETADKFGKGKASLAGRITEVNGKTLTDIVHQVNNLKDALSGAGIKAEELNLALSNIEKHNGGNGKGGSSKRPKKPPKKSATGGILPGYTPGVDVHKFMSPTGGELHLSGGEAVMRPEWTAVMGSGFVNEMNEAARKGGKRGVRKAMGFKRGGVLGIDKLVDLMRFRDVVPDVLGDFASMRLHGAADKLGGGVKGGVKGGGTSGAKAVGSDLGNKFEGLYNWFTKDSWDFLKKVPLPDGLSQVVGVIGGALSPIAGEYFWDDVWKGKGNILDRGGAFLGDMFSTKTLKGVVGNLFGGVLDSAKSIFHAGKAFITDPIGTVKDSVGAVWDMLSSEYGGAIDMVRNAKDIWDSPLKYAGQVVKDTWSTAKDSMPNTKGLFDFSGNKLNAKKPNISGLVDGQMSTPGVGSKVSRWAPQVRMALTQLGLPLSYTDLVLHRIGVESGGNPNAINTWDSNAKAGHPSQGLMQTIPGTFAAYAGPYKKRGILDPMASIFAGLNYAVHRYGPAGWTKALSGTKGYASGTEGASSGWAWVGERGPELVKFGGGETVLPHGMSMNVARGYAKGTVKDPSNGLAVAAEKGTSTLATAISKLYRLIQDAFSAGRINRGTESSLNGWLDKENKQLQGLVKKRADLAPKLKDANAKLAKVKADEKAMSDDISGQAKAGRSLTDVFNTSGATVSGALSTMKERLANIKSFASNLAKLSKLGFSKAIIAEVAKAGPEEGNEMAKALMSSNANQIKDFNNTYTAIGTASDSLGTSVSKDYYAAGEKAAQGLVDGLKSKDNALVKQIEKLADSVASTLRKRLKVSSKTPVPNDLAILLTWLTGISQATNGPKKPTKKKKGKGYASGTMSASPGIALVGEQGPEIVEFSGGERVRNARETSQIMGRPIEIHVHEAKSEDTTNAVLRALRYADVMYGGAAGGLPAAMTR